MKRNTFELSHFKKIAEDANTAVLKHPDGHEIKVSKNALAEHLKKQLKKLPMHLDAGGAVDYESQPPLKDPGLEDQRQMFLQQLKDSRSKESEMRNNQLDFQTGKKQKDIQPDMMMAYGGGKVPHYADGTPDGPVADDSRDPASSDDRPAGVGPLVIEADQNDPLNGPYAKVASPQTDDQVLPPQNVSLPGAGAYGPQPQVPAQPGVRPQEMIDKLSGEYQGQKQAALGIGQAQANQSQALAQANQQAADQFSDLHHAVQGFNQTMIGDLDTAAKEIKDGTINPNAYFDNKSTAGKAATAIGLILGGIGGGLTHQENPALKFLNQRIEDSVNAQKANQANKGTIFNAYLSKFGSVQHAADMTKSILQLKTAYDIQEAADKSNDPVQIQRANLLAHQIGADSVQKIYPMILQQGMLQYMQQHPDIDPSIAVRYLKQSGMLSEEQEKGANAEISKARENEALRQATYQSFTNLNKLSQQGLFSPARRSAEVNLLAGKIEVLSNHRYNSDSAQSLADSMLPRRFEGSETTDYKPHLIDRFFDSERSGETYLPSLAPFGISIPKGHVGGISRNNLNLPNYPKSKK